MDLNDETAPEAASPEEAQADAEMAAAFDRETATITPEAPEAIEQPVAGIEPEQLRADLAAGKQAVQVAQAAQAKLGAVERVVADLKTRAMTAPRTITAEMLKEVNAELPGLGDALARDLTKVLGSGQSFDPNAIVTAAVEAIQTDLLESRHPDYAKTVNTPEFKTWMNQQTAQRQQEIINSPRAAVAARALEQFSEWNQRGASQQRRLTGAITPKGGASAAFQGRSNPDSEEADFALGFRNVRGGAA